MTEFRGLEGRIASRRVHMGSITGHREAYQSLFARQFSLTPSAGRVTRHTFPGLVRAQALLFGTIDDDYRGFFAVALARALLGRRTVGLFLRPQTCFGRVGLRYKLKKAAFVVLKRVRFVSVFTIVPFSVAPHYRAIATDGVVDPQMWDMQMGGGAQSVDAELAKAIQAAADGRRVLAFIGTAHVGKGIEFLRDLITSPAWPRDVMPVVAGRVPENVRDIAEELSAGGALVLDRFLSDAELNSLYSEAQLIWACYRPDYDQASGIFGRSIQFGKTPVVRAGSLICGFARNIRVNTIELQYGSPSQADKLRTEPEQNLGGESIDSAIAAWRRDFETTVGNAL